MLLSPYSFDGHLLELNNAIVQHSLKLLTAFSILVFNSQVCTNWCSFWSSMCRSRKTMESNSKAAFFTSTSIFGCTFIYVPDWFVICFLSFVVCWYTYTKMDRYNCFHIPFTLCLIFLLAWIIAIYQLYPLLKFYQFWLNFGPYS